MPGQWCLQPLQVKKRWWSSMKPLQGDWLGSSLSIWRAARSRSQHSMMIYLNFFEKTCAWLMTLTMCGGSWQVKIRRRMWKAWHILLTTVYPWMKLLWNCGQGGSIAEHCFVQMWWFWTFATQFWLLRLLWWSGGKFNALGYNFTVGLASSTCRVFYSVELKVLEYDSTVGLAWSTGRAFCSFWHGSDGNLMRCGIQHDLWWWTGRVRISACEGGGYGLRCVFHMEHPRSSSSRPYWWKQCGDQQAPVRLLRMNMALVNAPGTMWKLRTLASWSRLWERSIGGGSGCGTKSWRRKLWVLLRVESMASGSNILSRKSGRWRRSWSWWTASIKKLLTAGRRLWQLHLVEMMLNQSPHTAQLRAVLQTYMVSLAEVTRDIDLWKEPLEAELQALVQSGTIRRAKADQVPQESGYDYMTVAPAKIVPTIKSPVGKRISA